MPDLAGIKPEDLWAINVDIPTVVARALGAIPHLLTLRPQIVDSLQKQPMHTIDRLEEYALASWYAHLLSLPGKKSEKKVAELLTEAAPLRENLLVAAEALAHAKLLDADAVAAIRAGQGHVDTANDLVALSATFLADWSTVANCTAVTIEQVERAGVLGPELLTALGVSEHGPVGPSSQDEAQLLRRRAFTLFARSYDEARRAVSYLRWHEDDVDSIMPSLFAKRGAGSRQTTPATPASAAPTAPTDPAQK
jgi:hypothetical protein